MLFYDFVLCGIQILSMTETNESKYKRKELSIFRDFHLVSYSLQLVTNVGL